MALDCFLPTALYTLVAIENAGAETMFAFMLKTASPSFEFSVFPPLKKSNNNSRNRYDNKYSGFRKFFLSFNFPSSEN